MKSYEVLGKAIPRGIAESIAERMHVSADYVRRWRREPLGDEAPTASGQRSPLDRVCDLIDAVFLSNPQGACLVVEHVRAHYNTLIETHTGAGFNGCSHERALASAELLKESAEAINALNVKGVTSETLHELIQMRDAADNVIARVTADMDFTTKEEQTK